jgi:hypothetical protein
MKGGPGDGNRNKYQHGRYARSIKPTGNLDNLLDDLLLRQAQMAHFLDQTVEQVEEDQAGIAQVVKFTSAHIANGLRIAKVLRKQQERQQRAGQNQRSGPLTNDKERR